MSSCINWFIASIVLLSIFMLCLSNFQEQCSIGYFFQVLNSQKYGYGQQGTHGTVHGYVGTVHGYVSTMHGYIGMVVGTVPMHTLPTVPTIYVPS